MTKKTPGNDRKGKNPIKSGAESLALLRGKLFKKGHQQQMFSMLLLREFKELRENEKFLLASISRIEVKFSKRNENYQNGEGDNSASKSLRSPIVGVVGEPAASVFGACGTCIDDANSEDSNPPSPPKQSANSVVGRRFLIKVEVAEKIPLRYKRCFLCAHASNNKDCAFCSFNEDHNKDDGVSLATELQEEYDAADTNGTSDERPNKH